MEVKKDVNFFAGMKTRAPKLPLWIRLLVFALFSASCAHKEIIPPEVISDPAISITARRRSWKVRRRQRKPFPGCGNHRKAAAGRKIEIKEEIWNNGIRERWNNDIPPEFLFLIGYH
jgi:hypothetical protein